MADKSKENLETEIKLAVPDSETFEKLNHLTAPAPFKLTSLGTKEIVDRYLDTADRSFIKAGYACRLRRNGEQLTLTLKALTPASDNLHRREELEATVSGDQPDAWGDNDAARLAREIAAAQPLETLFTLSQHRHKFEVSRQETAVIEYSLDKVWLAELAEAEDSDEGSAYLELELELLVDGAEEDLQQFVVALRERWPLAYEQRSKFERAYLAHFEDDELLADLLNQKKKTPPAKAKKQEKSGASKKHIGLMPIDSFAEAGRKVLAFHFERMLKQEKGTRRGKDIEALHDMRVATRRMRAAFKLFGPSYKKKAAKPLLKGLKTTGRALGPVRDLDVFMEKLEEYRASLSEEEKDEFKIFIDIWHSKRSQARKKMLAYLNSAAYKTFKSEFKTFVSTPGLGVKAIPEEIPPIPYQLRHVVPGLIYSAYDQVRAYETVLKNAPIDTLHQLRISLKGLRYALEFFYEILEDDNKMVISEVKNLQNHLGDLNDADVASKILREFLADWEEHQLHLPLSERHSPGPIAAYLNTKLEERHRLVVSFPKAWKHFNRPAFRENLARSLCHL